MLTCQSPVIPHSDLNRATQDVYETLRRLANHKQVCRETFNTLATKSGYSCSTVQRALRELQQQHYIRVVHYFDKRGRTLVNGYHLRSPTEMGSSTGMGKIQPTPVSHF